MVGFCIFLYNKSSLPEVCLNQGSAQTSPPPVKECENQSLWGFAGFFGGNCCSLNDLTSLQLSEKIVTHVAMFLDVFLQLNCGSEN